MGSGNAQNILNMILGGGQSLAAGYASLPVVSGSAAYPTRALMFNNGVRCGLNPASPGLTLSGSALTSLVGLLEADDGFAFAGNDDGETIGAGFSFGVNDRLTHYMLFAELGIDGTAYAGLARGGSTPAYANMLVAIARAIALSAKSVIVRALTWTHGEEDAILGTTAAQYEADLLQIQQNLTADAQALTGQGALVALFLDQFSAWTNSLIDLATSPIPQAQLNAAVNNPDRIFLVGPKYFLSYVGGLHLTAHSEEILGEYHAKAYYQAIVKGLAWKPVYPISIVSDGASPSHITITFNVPVAPLVLDTSLVSDPGNKGFEYSDASGVTISSVAVQNGNQVKLTMSGQASASNRNVRYAWTGTAGNNAGPTTGPRGCLRDSDPALSRLGDSTPLYNWCCHFSETF